MEEEARSSVNLMRAAGERRDALMAEGETVSEKVVGGVSRSGRR